jgi:hypothetical protein
MNFIFLSTVLSHVKELSLKQRSALLLSLGVILVLLISACGGGGRATTRRLTVNITGNGSVISDPAGIDEDTNQFSFPNNTPVTLTATPDDNEAVIWGGACEGASGDTCEVIMNADKTVSVTFAAAQTLTVTKDGTGSGTVTSNPAGIDCGDTCEAQFENGSTVVLTATPATGSQAVVWGGACSGASGNTCSVTMDDAKTVTATFNVPPGQQQLAVTKSGLGTVTSSPAGINCGNTCTNSFNEGVTVTLTASPANGEAVIWGGACADASGNSCTVTMSEARNVSVAFTFEVTITKDGTGSGTVTSDPAGIDCGSTCTANLPSGTEVSFTGTADSGSRFDGWDGDCTGEECILTIDSDKAITATFTEVVTLTVTRQGNGTGTVTSQPAGINCGDTCAAGFDIDGTVTLTAAATLPNYVASWGGACSGSSGLTCTVTMSEAKSASVTFEEATGGPFELNLNLTGFGDGNAQVTIRNENTGQTVTVRTNNPNPPSVVQPPFSNTYFAGTRLTLTATAIGNTTIFDELTGCDSVQDNVCTLLMTTDKNVGAAFFRTTPELSLGNGANDGEEFLAGSLQNQVNLTGSNLRMAYRPEQSSQTVIGLRWGLPVPQGAEIIEAFIQFTASSADGSGPVTLSVRAEAANTSETFTNTDNNFTSRDKTTANVTWNPPNWTTGERSENTRVTVTSLVQEVVNQGGWAQNNNIAFFIQRAAGTGGNNYRQAHAYDGSAGQAAVLVVRFRAPAP